MFAAASASTLHRVRNGPSSAAVLDARTLGLSLLGLAELGDHLAPVAP
jgi:hypothetical protein